MNTVEPLRLYADKTMTAQWAYVPLLYPFWGPLLKDTTPYLSRAYGKHGWDPAYFTLVPRLEDAEYILVPHDYWWLKANRPDLLAQYVALSERSRVPLLVEALSDKDGRVALPHARILRANQYRFDLPVDEITTPYAVEDLLESYAGGELVTRAKRAIPSIGFAGFAGVPLPQRLRRGIKELPIRLRTIVDKRYLARWSGRLWREWAMDAFSRSTRVESHFIRRPSYSGHSKTVAGDMQRNREEFVRNLMGCDYALCVKGDPNASQRFYEALAVGRIPVLIDTACVLPLENHIDYRTCSVSIDYRDLSRAPDILADFHANLTDQEFRAMQERARYVFEHYLRIDSFSKYLVQALREHTLAL